MCLYYQQLLSGGHRNKLNSTNLHRHKLSFRIDLISKVELFIRFPHPPDNKPHSKKIRSTYCEAGAVMMSFAISYSLKYVALRSCTIENQLCCCYIEIHHLCSNLAGPVLSPCWCQSTNKSIGPSFSLQVMKHRCNQGPRSC